MDKGFSLVEVMITLVIISIGIVGFSGLQKVMMRTSWQSGYANTAKNLAQTKLESFRLIMEKGQFETIHSGLEASIVVGGMSFHCHWKVSRANNLALVTSAASPKEIEVTVSWPGKTGKRESVSVKGRVSPFSGLLAPGISELLNDRPDPTAGISSWQLFQEYRQGEYVTFQDKLYYAREDIHQGHPPATDRGLELGMWEYAGEIK